MISESYASLYIKTRYHTKKGIISYNKNKITVHYNDGTKETFKTNLNDMVLFYVYLHIRKLW